MLQILCDINIFQVAVRNALFQLGRVEQMVDQRIKSFNIVEHEADKIGLFLGADLPPAQRLQIEFQRSEWRFQFMSHAIDEVRLTAIQIDGFDRQGEIHDDAHQHKGEKGGADGQQCPVKWCPATVGRSTES